MSQNSKIKENNFKWDHGIWNITDNANKYFMGEHQKATKRANVYIQIRLWYYWHTQAGVMINKGENSLKKKKDKMMQAMSKF